MHLFFKNSIRITVTVYLILSILQVKAEAPVLTKAELLNPPHRIIRTCCSFGADMGYIGIPFAKKNDITSPGLIGPHKFLGGKDENNGNIYTRRGGFLDLGHLRDCADWTSYLYRLIIASKTNREFVIMDLGNEGGSKSLTLRVPDNISNEDAIELAGKIAYDLSVWHEISTWFGSSYVPLVPERFSSFSPEDLYSNLMGVHLAKQAIKSNLEYEEAMTRALADMLKNLEAVDSEEETYSAMQKVDRLWYTSQKRLPNKKILLKRYLDSGSNLLPWLVPEMESFRPPYVLKKPAENLSDLYQLNIKLNFKFPVKDIFTDSGDRIITQKDFDVFIDFIQNDLNELEAKEEIHENRVSKRKESKENEESMN